MDFAVALEGEDVRADAVEKIAVMADHAGHAGECHQRLLQHAQRGQVEVVRRLVQDEEIAAALQNPRQQQPAALAAAQLFHLGHDPVVAEQEPFQVGSHGQLGFAPLHEFRAVGYLVQHGALLVELETALVHIIEFGELADLDRARGRRQLANDDFEQRGFAEAVAAADADASPVFKREIEAGKQGLSAEIHPQAGDLNGAVAQLRRRRDAQFHVLLDHRSVLGRLIVIPLKPVLLLAALGARALSHPGEFLFQEHLALVLDHRVSLLPLGLGQEIVGVIAVVRKKLAVVKLQDARGDAVEEIAVVGDDQERAAKGLQKFSHPLDRFRIQMVGRFVEHQKIRARNDRPCHRHPPLLAAGERFDIAVRRRAIQVGQCHLDAAVHRPAIECGDALLQFLVSLRVMRQRLEFGDEIQHVLGAVPDVFMNIFGLVEHEILGQVAHRQIALAGHFAAVCVLQAGENLQKRRLAAAVAADEADAVALLNAERDGVKNSALVVAHGDFGGGEEGGHGKAMIKDEL